MKKRLTAARLSKERALANAGYVAPWRDARMHDACNGHPDGPDVGWGKAYWHPKVTDASPACALLRLNKAAALSSRVAGMTPREASMCGKVKEKAKARERAASMKKVNQLVIQFMIPQYIWPNSQWHQFRRSRSAPVLPASAGQLLRSVSRPRRSGRHLMLKRGRDCG